MAQIDKMLIDFPLEMANAETIKELILGRLHKEGHISDEVAQDFNDNWQIVILKKSWFKRLFSKLKKSNNKLEDGYHYHFVRLSDTI